ncbi:hypothetical protein D3C76_1055290 [compost metagenome]
MIEARGPGPAIALNRCRGQGRHRDLGAVGQGAQQSGLLWRGEPRRVEALGGQAKTAELGEQGLIARSNRIVLEGCSQFTEEIQAIVTRGR